MVWHYYLPPIVAGIITLWVLKISYFFITRRYKQPVAYQNSAEESDVYGSSENLSSSESLNLDQEKKMVDINNITRCSSNGSTEDEMQESKNYTTTQDVLDTFKCNSDSNSSIMSWESCHEGISHSELDFVNCPSLENHPEICQPLNLCMRDKKNETGTINKITRTYFTDRKHKSIKGIPEKTPEKYLGTKMIEDYDQYELKNKNKLEITKISAKHHDELKDEYSLDMTEYELKNRNKLEITKLSSKDHEELEDEYSLNNGEQELKDDNLEISEISSIHCDELKDEYSLDMTELSSKYHEELEDEYSLNNREQELKDDNNLEISEISAKLHDELKGEYSLDVTEYELKNRNKLEITKLFSKDREELEDEYCLNNREQELKDDNLEISEISYTDCDELKDEYSLDMIEYELKNKNELEITKLSSKDREELEDEYSLNNGENSSNDDHVMLANVLETTGVSPIYQDGQKYDYKFLTSPELSSLNNEKSISGIDSPNIKFHHDEVEDINGCRNTCSSECTESLPSPIFNNDDNDSIDDIRYVEDYSDISFFDPTLSDDALNEAFVIVEDI